eukprot:scaffold367532_cov15-Prasinocladus_malaysianus.AAC.1
MAIRHQDILKLLKLHPDILTHAVRLILARAPIDLEWVQLHKRNSYDTMAAFEAMGCDGYLYSINVLDGTVLKNGCPP